MQMGLASNWQTPRSPTMDRKEPSSANNAQRQQQQATNSPSYLRRHSYSGPTTPTNYVFPPPKLEECLFSWPLASIVVPPNAPVQMPNYAAPYYAAPYCYCCVTPAPTSHQTAAPPTPYGYTYPPFHNYYYHPPAHTMPHPLDLQVSSKLAPYNPQNTEPVHSKVKLPSIKELFTPSNTSAPVANEPVMVKNTIPTTGSISNVKGQPKDKKKKSDNPKRRRNSMEIVEVAVVQS